MNVHAALFHTMEVNGNQGCRAPKMTKSIIKNDCVNSEDTEYRIFTMFMAI